MNERPVSFLSAGETIQGTLHDAGESECGLILLSGWGGTRYGPQRILVEAARAAAASGRTSLRFDFRGRGDSTGDPATVTLDGMIEDTSAAANWLAENCGTKKLAFLGLCAGANVAIGAASLMPERTDQLIAWSILPFMEHKAKAHGKQNRTRTALLKHYAKKAPNWKLFLKLCLMLTIGLLLMGLF